jgi:NAD(P)-dependent dehydrogenase (short-subunit alcohol dehydrogenase family)
LEVGGGAISLVDLTVNIFTHVNLLLLRGNTQNVKLTSMSILKSCESFEARQQPQLHEESFMSRLAGKIAIITGATGGIGMATARKFLEEGASVMIAGRDEESLKNAAAQLGDNSRVAFAAGQPADEHDVVALINQAVQRFGRIDIMVANAGSEGDVLPLTMTDVDSFDATVRANLRSTFLAIKHAGLAMAGQGGSIVTMGSVTSEVGVAGIGPYAATKHAIAGLTKAAALELASSNIRVNTVAPAPIDNAMMQSIEQKAAPGNPEAARAGFSSLIAMRRYGKNEEVANLIAFLSSDEASFITGSVYPIDGGFLAA